MAKTTQEKLYETFIAISGGQPSSRDPFIDASQELATSAGVSAKVKDSTVKMGTVAAGLQDPVGRPGPGPVPEPVGRPASGPVPDPAGLLSSGPMPDPAAEFTSLADVIRMV